ncbi:MAG: phytanoyl-CoA dioxygenase family protein [Kofleriaceae bacterium]|nr:phytanoyl-CoA dioxygenase family protein [Kofleriaceae bacterium]MCB9574461.1 phytanoyl-CoA dioxygenase family protein [Kofleriaceae bacterium]
MPAAPDPVTAFARDGVTPLGRVLDDAQLEVARAAFADAQVHGVTGGYARIVHDAWRRAPALAALIPQLGAAACAAIGEPALVLFHDHLLDKPPGGDDMAWHQDFSYLPLDRAGGVTLWVALDDIDVANGCLYYVLGSHVHGERRAAWGLGDPDDPRAALPPIDVPAGEPGVPIAATAGTALAHHTLLWHRSPRNDSARPRRSWALSFVVPDARWSPRHAPHPRSAVAPRHDGQDLEPDLPRVTATIQR